MVACVLSRQRSGGWGPGTDPDSPPICGHLARSPSPRAPGAPCRAGLLGSAVPRAGEACTPFPETRVLVSTGNRLPGQEQERGCGHGQGRRGPGGRGGGSSGGQRRVCGDGGVGGGSGRQVRGSALPRVVAVASAATCGARPGPGQHGPVSAGRGGDGPPPSGLAAVERCPPGDGARGPSGSAGKGTGSGPAIWVDTPAYGLGPLASAM